MTNSGKLALSGTHGIRVLRRQLLARRAVLLGELQEHVRAAASPG